ncbi:discoidin domain-containing protein [Gluconobacter roseus]|uniref:F5/8 type C domain-containing protein n=1 Tax=Gluconobacter roseus NBRC 3990 TaxID=1307950 RepID=A0A4Y3M453_9PROT|nr:discoidin domain-containing protein [Gluconobacter roseus]GBR48139.1 hypothetical protein AA3990_2009 [Gluconobacter roseus NBRC 3990]GEB03403.1 hypothetical protein GRO01_09790 [Gluconobacter roseus NBRC 3990]GLP93861.1 hypothetical protein GCM10007871_18390 [Gluconobacter roseus NBRC 3990]
MSKNEEVAVIYRTHYWNEDTEYLARKLYGQSLGYQFFVTCDETNKTIDVGNFNKISHTNDPASLGLKPKSGHEPNLWFDADFVFYYLVRSLPKVKYFFLIENDCSLNINLEELIKGVVEKDIDLVGQIFDPKENDWPQKTIDCYYGEVKQMLFPFVMLSRKLILKLYEERLRIKSMYDSDTASYSWPYCEAFISSYVYSTGGFKVINLNDLYDMSRYKFRPHNYIYSGISNIPNSIIHPVLGKDFLKKALEVLNVSEIFDPDSDLSKNLETFPSEISIPLLSEAILKLKSPQKVDSFWQLALKRRWIQSMPRKNIAFAKPALQSSVSEWSMEKELDKDARLVTEAFNHSTMWNHTAIEENPWWQVDLESSERIKTILIYPRHYLYERMNRFIISISDDGLNWNEIYSKNDDQPIYRGEDIGFVVDLDEYYTTRFIKMTLPGESAIHLTSFEVFE